MNKIHILALMFLGTLTFGTFATAAFAENEILLNGSMISTEVSAEMSFELLLEDAGAVGKPDALCSGIFEDTVEAGGRLILTKKILKLTKVSAENSLECTDDSSVCSSPLIVTALNLPWHLEIERMEELLFLLDWLEEAGKIQSYAADCNSVLGLIEDVCSGLSSVDLNNVAWGIVTLWKLASKIGTENLECSQSPGKLEGILEGEGAMTSSEGTLSVS